MVQAKIIILAVMLVGLGSAFEIESEQVEMVPILQDMRNNITDLEWNTIIQSMKQAETMYLPTDYQKIARYMSLNVQSVLKQPLWEWNAYVHEGRIRQMGISNTQNLNKFACILNFGNYNLTYTMIAVNSLVCGPLKWRNGGSSTQQWGVLSEQQRTDILQGIDNGITQKGDNIMANAEVVQSAARITAGYYWSVVIADPSARFGYYACMPYFDTWFSLRAFKDYKWNYFGSAHN